LVRSVRASCALNAQFQCCLRSTREPLTTVRNMATDTPSGGRAKRGEPVAWIRYDDESVHEVPFTQLRAADFSWSVPWRKFRSVRGQTHYPGRYASATMNGPVMYESRLELARLLLADFDPIVKAIYAQPCRMVARVDGKVRRHVPDFLLLTVSGTVRVVNVKPATRLADPKVAEALAWPGAVIERHGWEYEIWSGADRTVLENVRFLAAYRRSGVVPQADIERAWQLVQDGDQLAVAERRVAAGRLRCEARPPIMALIWSGRLTTDLSRPLTGDWVLRRAS